MESAFLGSHDSCVQTFRDAAAVIGEETAEQLIAHLNAKRIETAKLLPELTRVTNRIIRSEVGDSPVLYWDFPVHKTDKNPPEILVDIARVKRAFEQAVDLVLGLPTKPFEIERGSES